MSALSGDHPVDRPFHRLQPDSRLDILARERAGHRLDPVALAGLREMLSEAGSRTEPPR